jgi:hypothetical protein
VRGLTAVLIVFALTPVAAASTGASTWKTHTVKASGFSVAAPDTWIDVTRLSPQVLAKMNEIPSLRQYVDLAKQSKAIKLILVDAGTTTVKNHYATNMNVVEVPALGDLQLLRDATVAQLKSTGIVTGGVSSSYVTLPAGKAVKLQYRARYTTSAPVVSLLQYILLRNGTSAVLTYTTLPKLQGTYGAAFTRSARSFRFLQA